MTTTTPVHISIVLDRSGSMGQIAEDIVGGFNEFLDRQKETEGEARVTLVQFDSEDPFELLVDGTDLNEVAHLARSAYQPRSLTPLYDAVGRMITKIDTAILHRADAGKPIEDQLVVIVTDGLENASKEFNRTKVFEMVTQRRDLGWIFVFLGADQDSYIEGEQYGVAPGNRADWSKTKAGSKKLFKDIAYSTTKHRMRSDLEREQSRDLFYEEDPDTEESGE